MNREVMKYLGYRRRKGILEQAVEDLGIKRDMFELPESTYKVHYENENEDVVMELVRATDAYEAIEIVESMNELNRVGDISKIE